ncbi:SH3 domain-containing protein [Rhizobium laguerreae]|uniref:SH3 domain-containing protein n=1 Tax=Rhizobium laguerreae TaxID=1076926 RepID=UPI001C91C88A|nr:SH3 domain-containing protein [Rhizobium laguerreae]MBY3386543.1 SH3 domain-containing protein [Rhizobium laguerreae]MBY3400626.1 SH3 domain-containing protein [Rhizobium laguerreae]MBY3407564.1 SH3 domain-containing protein [Rhizobium laguerreae]
MRRKRRSRKQTKTKLTPAVVFLVFGIGLIASFFHKSEAPSIEPQRLPAANQDVIDNRSTVAEEAVETSAPVPSVTAEAPQAVAAVTRFVKGRKVALRNGPGKTFGILDRYDSGRELVVTETNGDWSKVRDGLTRREGWISTALLSDERPSTPQPDQLEQRASKEADTRTGADPVTPTMPQISDSIVIQRIIAESISIYPGSCACPYNTDRGGRRCGKRSAYNRGGGYAPICFAGDVSPDMIQSFRQQSSR